MLKFARYESVLARTAPWPGARVLVTRSLLAGRAGMCTTGVLPTGPETVTPWFALTGVPPDEQPARAIMMADAGTRPATRPAARRFTRLGYRPGGPGTGSGPRGPAGPGDVGADGVRGRPGSKVVSRFWLNTQIV